MSDQQPQHPTPTSTPTGHSPQQQPGQQQQLQQQSQLLSSPSSSASSAGGGAAVPPNGNNTQSIADYLAQLLKDKKQLAAFPNVFLHVERLLDDGKISLKSPESIFKYP